MNIAHGEVLGAAAVAAGLAADRTPEVITWYAIVLAVLLVTVVVALRHRHR
ncbi:hypothetical protein ACI2L4_12440 [Streptomyces sparsogenes]|uniref:hypothetical protein n=1 Tax=Streptomyces sparsogenes TaxID=67365 RepID=UPI003406E3FD